MIRIYLLLILFLSFSLCKANSRDSIIKKACIVHFKIISRNPTINNEILLKPLYDQLRRVFKIDSIINIEEDIIQWVDEFSNSKDNKELLPVELAKVKATTPDLIFTIRFEHWLADRFPLRGKKHVLLFTLTIFDSSGKRVWNLKKKKACCRSLEFGSGEFTDDDYPVDKEIFLELYQSVIKKAFGSF